MIALVSSNRHERAAFVSLCEQQGWPCLECESVRAFGQALRRVRPKVAVIRHALTDGYSDDAMALLAAARALPAVKVIVLLNPSIAPIVEARQITLGADCVRRDPVHSEVLLAFLEKYRRAPRAASRAHRPTAAQEFAGATLLPLERTLRRGTRTVVLTPREAQLAELLVQHGGHIISYDTLFGEILRRPFRGDSSNLRVLLGMLIRSAEKIGVPLRRWVEVIPKTGYRYRGAKPNGGR